MQTQDLNPKRTMRGEFERTRIPLATAEYEAGAVIYRQGGDGHHVMYIETGRVRLGVIDSGGREGICGLLGTRAFLGEDALVGDAVRRHTAVALVPTQLIVIAKTDMSWLLRTQPAVADQFLAHVVWRHTRLQEDLAALLVDSGEERLARTLLLLAEFDARRPCRCALPQISQEILAEMVGTSRTRVNRLLGKFKKLGLVEAQGTTLLVTPQLYHTLSDGYRRASVQAARDVQAVAV